MTGSVDMAERLTEWGEARADVRALLVIGSRARTNKPADPWSDLDAVLVTTHPERYLDDGAWLEGLGRPWLTYLEATATGGRIERRALFDDAVDVDFIVVAAAEFSNLLEGGLPGDVADVLSRGYRFLLDKDGMSGRIGVIARPALVKPSQAEFTNVVDDFWYHAVWVAKKLLRGEVWTALGGGTYMQRSSLLPMVTWHTKARHGWGYETWYGGRFLEEWADPQIVRELSGVFAHYGRRDVERALLVSMEVFARLASETAEHLGYAYGREAETRVTTWVIKALEAS